MPLNIRDYINTDRENCLKAFKSNVPYYFTKHEIEEFETFLIKLEKGELSTHFYVVELDKQVIGCGGFGDKNNSKIISLAWGLIHKAYHKKGFGKKLLIHRLKQIKKLYFNYPVVIDTTQYSTGFFSKFGFLTTKITENYYTIGMHRYDMTLAD